MINSLVYCKAVSMFGRYLKRTDVFSRRRRKRIPEVFAVIRMISRAKA